MVCKCRVYPGMRECHKYDTDSYEGQLRVHGIKGSNGRMYGGFRVVISIDSEIRRCMVCVRQEGVVGHGKVLL